ncbi:DUF669 domain-containing protein [Terribacillus sp. 179-K 1B1 HS]|uniref:DUF669 domain-containing protein n=1 Tax=Terribacillus sp. 179-K 1B1 HS TaxID=3142388 RepID=UPI0039A17EF1
MFKIDHNNVGSEPIKPGEYEVVPVTYDKKWSTNGNERIIFNYEIRSDVDQPSQGQEIRFDNFTIVENAQWRVNSASKAAMIPDGTPFNSAEEWAQAMIGRPLRVVVGEREHNGKKYPEVKAFKQPQASGLPSFSNNNNQQQNNNQSNQDPFKNNGGPIDISDDDLPF